MKKENENTDGFVREVQKSNVVSEGRHQGEIVDVKKRITPKQGYEYIDVFIETDEGELKYGCPDNVSTRSKLGQLLSNFVDLGDGKKVNVKDVLMGETVSFLVYHEENDAGTFARIQPDSVKAVEPGPDIEVTEVD